MTCVARRALGILRDGDGSCQPFTDRRPRHDWSMRLLGGDRGTLPTGREAAPAKVRVRPAFYSTSADESSAGRY